MKKIHILLLSTIIFATHIYGMEEAKKKEIIPLPFVDEINEHILLMSIKYPHEHFETIEGMQKFLRALSCVNKKYHAYVNNPIITRNNINNLARKLGNYNSTIAKLLKTTGAKNYLTCSQQLYGVHENDMKDLIMRGADVKYQPAHDFSFLSHLTIFESSYACNLKKMAIALECGADVNGGQGYYGGPLFYAITSGFIDKIKLLLSYKPACKWLHEAIEKCNIEILDLLFAAGESPSEAVSIFQKKRYPLEPIQKTVLQHCLNKQNMELLEKNSPLQ